MSRLVETISPETLSDCLKSLSFKGMYDRFHDIVPAAPGTCEWPTKHQTYCEWYNCPRGLLWIKGKPGAGKSTLLRHLLQQSRSRGDSGEQRLVLSFFFHGRGTELQKNELGLFRSLLHQLRDVPAALKKVVKAFQGYCEDHGTQGEMWQWHPGELRAYFSSALLIALESRPVWLYIDALDECGENAAKQLVDDFESILDIHSTKRLQNLHICFTCRHYPIFKHFFKYEINVEKENTTDISTFVRRELFSLFRKGDTSILNSITSRADGVFLWAWLVVKKVAQLQLNAASVEELDRAVRDIPTKLDEIYSEIIQRLNPVSYKLFIWICFALRPLSVEEMGWAMRMRTDSRCDSLDEFRNADEDQPDFRTMSTRVQVLSGGLAEVTSDTIIVQFIHQSVKDFFVADGASVLAKMTTLVGVNPALPNFVGMAHYWLSRFCIRSISNDKADYDLLSSNGRTYPLLRYATVSCLLHAKESAKRGISQRDLLEYFAWPSEVLMRRWIELYISISDTVPREMTLSVQRTTMAHLFLQNELVDPVLALIENEDWVKTGLHQLDEQRRTLLSIASMTCQPDIVEYLLEKGASPNIKDADGRMPLNYAISRSNVCIIEQLLRHGGTVGDESQVDFFHPDDKDHAAILKLFLKHASNNAEISSFLFQTLHTAAFIGHSDIVGLLLTRRFDVDEMEDGDRPALHHAALSGHSEVVHQLIAAGSDVNTRTETGDSALILAAQQRNRNVVEQLISAGSDVNAQNEAGYSALILAALWGNRDVAEQLIAASSDVNAQNKAGDSALILAAHGGYRAVTEQLIAAGSDVNAQNKAGNSALILAAQQGNRKVVEQLIAAGSDVNTQNMAGDSALLLAAHGGYSEVVEQLVTAGSDVNALNLAGRSSFYEALWCAHSNVAAQLSDAGAELPVDLPIRDAIRLNKLSTINLMLSYGIAFDTADHDGRTPLFDAAKAGFLQIVTLLLESGADTSRTDIQGRTALFSAIESKNVAVVEMLVESNATIDLTDNHGRTALFSAVENDCLSIVELLAQNYATMNFQDISGRTALFLAKSEPIAEMLINGGCNVDTMDVMGRTELSLAAEEGNAELTRVLLTNGADIHSTDTQGQTPLWYAIHRDRSEIMRQFLDGRVDIGHVDGNRRSLLYHAACKDAESVLELLLDKGMDINRLGEDRRTLLSEASEEGNRRAAALLLRHGADPNIPDLDGKTPLLRAASQGHAAVVSELLSRGAAADLTDHRGWTALAWAAFELHEETVALLIGNGANVNAADTEWRTPLWYAYHKSSESESSNVIRQLLIEAGAETSLSPAAQSPGSWLSDSPNESEEEYF